MNRRNFIHNTAFTVGALTFAQKNMLTSFFEDPWKITMLTDKLGIFEEKWDKKYPMCVSSWKNNWTELSTYFKYPEGIRKLVYTTNAMENFNRQLRKVTKNKTIFPNDYALQKSLYLAMVDASSKWTYRIRGWDQILSQLSIFFEGRF